MPLTMVKPPPLRRESAYELKLWTDRPSPHVSFLLDGILSMRFVRRGASRELAVITRKPIRPKASAGMDEMKRCGFKHERKTLRT